MQKKVIPLLIVLMVTALAGIITVQVFWVRLFIEEKQSLIDHKILQAITNTDLKLDNRGAIALFSQSDSSNWKWSDSLIFSEHSDSIHSNVRVVRANNQDSVFLHVMDDEKIEIKRDSGAENESNITISHQIIRHSNAADSMKFELQLIEEELMQLENVRTVFENIRFETNTAGVDVRLDSAMIEKSLKSDMQSMNLDTQFTWSVFDGLENNIVFNQTMHDNYTHELPLFRKDIIHPGRFLLRLNVKNHASLIWRDIKWMILLSAIFAFILVSVFIISIRQIIRHKKISQLKTDFMNNMTHEFKTPLSSISLAADSILHPRIIGDQTKVKENVQIIQAEKNKLNQNIERILEIAALEKNQIEIPLEKINLNSIIEDCIKNMDLLIRSKKAKVNIELENNITINANEFHLSRSISNIIDNSLKYTNGEPEIRILVTKQNDKIRMTISDNGYGISSENLKKIFDAFYRAETGNIHNTKGFGIGLTYTRFVLERMHANININSSEGSGTTVIVEFNAL